MIHIWVQPAYAGRRWLVNVYVAQARDEGLLDSDSVELWESNKLTASDRLILITQRTGRAVDKIDSDIKNRTRLFEKTGLAMAADGSDNNLISLEGVTKGTYSFKVGYGHHTGAARLRAFDFTCSR